MNLVKGLAEAGNGKADFVASASDRIQAKVMSMLQCKSIYRIHFYIIKLIK